jgi:hypothetical protein
MDRRHEVATLIQLVEARTKVQLALADSPEPQRRALAIFDESIARVAEKLSEPGPAIEPTPTLTVTPQLTVENTGSARRPTLWGRIASDDPFAPQIPAITKATKEVARALRELGGEATMGEIAAKLGLDRRTVSVRITRAINQGVLQRVSTARYRLTDSPLPQNSTSEGDAIDITGGTTVTK